MLAHNAHVQRRVWCRFHLPVGAPPVQPQSMRDVLCAEMLLLRFHFITVMITMIRMVISNNLQR